MIRKEDITEIGKFQKTHALKGELNLYLDVNEEILNSNIPIIVETEGILVPYFIESIRPKGKHTFLVKLEGIDSEEEAKKFVNNSLYALKEDLKTFYQTEEGEELITEDTLVGYIVIDSETGIKIGEITYIDSSTSNILMHIETPSGETVYIPVVEEWIMGIEPESKEIEMALPDGLINLNIKNKEDGR